MANPGEAICNYAYAFERTIVSAARQVGGTRVRWLRFATSLQTGYLIQDIGSWNWSFDDANVLNAVDGTDINNLFIGGNATRQLSPGVTANYGSAWRLLNVGNLHPVGETFRFGVGQWAIKRVGSRIIGWGISALAGRRIAICEWAGGDWAPILISQPNPTGQVLDVAGDDNILIVAGDFAAQWNYAVPFYVASGHTRQINALYARGNGWQTISSEARINDGTIREGDLAGTVIDTVGADSNIIAIPDTNAQYALSGFRTRRSI